MRLHLGRHPRQLLVNTPQLRVLLQQDPILLIQLLVHAILPVIPIRHRRLSRKLRRRLPSTFRQALRSVILIVHLLCHLLQVLHVRDQHRP